jgi:uncharacterized protein with von Willebrand factor type A (vWA) domain
MLEVLGGFVAELRRCGLPVSVAEQADAARALGYLRIEDRQAFKVALSATLVKDSEHQGAFDTAFEIYFSLRSPLGSRDAEDLGSDQGHDWQAATSALASSQPALGHESPSAEAIFEMLLGALRDGNRGALAILARLAVDRYGSFEPGRLVTSNYYLHRTLRGLDLDALRERLVAETLGASGSMLSLAETGDDDQSPLAPVLRGSRQGRRSALEQWLAADEYQALIDELTGQIEAEIRRRLVADRGVQSLAASSRKPLPSEVDFMRASREELAAMRKAIGPLTRRLAARLARKRRHLRRGALDFRATMRSSLSYGGVPVEPRFKRPTPSKPEIWVIADISGSVAAFARFTLHLIHAISTEFSKVRSFVFIDGIDEVTEIFERSETVAEALSRVNSEAQVLWQEGHSDYGHALSSFYASWGQEIGPRATILLLGDARNNYHASQSFVLRDLRRLGKRRLDRR